MANIPTASANPGDLKGASGSITQYSSPQEGGAALLNDLTAKMTGTSKTGLNGNSTLAQFSSVYAPKGNGNNDPQQYTANLANDLGVAPDATIGSLMPRIGDFANAVSKNEGFESSEPTDDAPSNPALSSVLFGTPATTDASNGQPQGEQTGFLKKYGIPLAATGIGVAGALLTPLTGGASDVAAEAADTALAGDAATDAASATASGGGLLGKIGGGLKGLATGALGLAGVQDAYNDIKGAVSGITGKAPNADPNASLEAQETSDTASQEQNAQALAQQQQQQAQELEDAKSAQSQTAQGLNTVLSQSAVGTRLAQNPLIQSGISNGLAKNGIVPTEGENGLYSTQGDQESVDTILNEVEDHENQLHDAEGATGSIAGIQAKADSIIEKTLPSTQWDEAKTVARKDLKSYSSKFGNGAGGDEIPLGSEGAGRIRREGYKAYDHNSSAASNGARKALGSAANSHILEMSKHKELIGKLHKEKQDLIHGKKVLKYLDGKKVVKQHGRLQGLLHDYGKYVGVAIGDKVGGPLGAVLGEMIGTHLSRAVDKKYGKHLFDTPAMKKATEILKGKNPAVYAEVKRELKKYEVQVEKEKRMETKRSEYREKKNPKAEQKKSEYEPYQKEGVIHAGTVPKKKIEGPTIDSDTAPKVHVPLMKQLIEKKKKEKKELYTPYEKELPNIDFGKTPLLKHKKTVKDLPIIR